jgi:hypothetical protein
MAMIGMSSRSFGLMYVANRVVHMDPAHLQSAVFLQLVVGGHLMLFVTRSRGAFWYPLHTPLPVTRMLEGC